MFQAQLSRFSSMSSLPLQFLPDLVIIPLHRGAVHLQFPGNQGLAGHAGVLPQVGSDSLLLGAHPVRIFRTRSGAEGGNLRFHLQDQHFEFLLALLTGLGVDVPRVLFPVRPHWGVAPLPEMFPQLADAPSSRPAPGRFHRHKVLLWGFVCLFRHVVMVPLVGMMFGNVIGGVTSYLAYKYEMTQALSSWLVGHFSLVLKGRYEIVWLTVPLVILAFVFANHFNIVGLGKDFSKNLGVPYNLVLFSGLTIAAMITASIVVVVGSISYIGLIVPNVVAMYKGDKIRGTLVDTALFGAIFVLVCDMIGRAVIAPYELPIELIVGILGSIIFIALLFYRLKHGRKAIRLGGGGTGCCSAMPNLKGGADS